MSENNSTPDSTPTPDAHAETAPTQAYPDGRPAEATAAQQTPAADRTAAPAASDARPRRRGRTALLAGAGVVGAALLIGGGVAIGSALDDDDDDRVAGLVADQGGDAGSTSDDRTEASDDDGTADQGDSTGADSGDDGVDDSGDSGDDGSALPASAGAATAAELDEIGRAAASVADGDPVSIDANRDGSWDVTLRGADGSETEVLVAADGTATVQETEPADGDDRAATHVLDAATLEKMVSAALAEADGRIIDIDADDDNRSPFDVSVLTGDDRIVEVTLDASGAVIGTELDD
ncbi:hypothetical protein AB3M83_01170 [Microbacterium sp. 179-B 1A2 NHS]|uniref:hypothetical protein n=1 Tax=Microbacterium sp. 179-B 1A2 NHS TaxID=3142383 RepID=UPI0039A37373